MLFLKKTGFLILTSFAILANWSIVLGGTWRKETDWSGSQSKGFKEIGSPNFNWAKKLFSFFIFLTFFLTCFEHGFATQWQKTADPFQVHSVVKKPNDTTDVYVRHSDRIVLKYEVENILGQKVYGAVQVGVKFKINGTYTPQNTWADYSNPQSGLQEYSDFIDTPPEWSVPGETYILAHLWRVDWGEPQYVAYIRVHLLPNSNTQNSLNNPISQTGSHSYFTDNSDQIWPGDFDKGNSISVWQGGNEIDYPIIIVEGFDAKNKVYSQSFYNDISSFIQILQNTSPEADILLFDYSDGGQDLAKLGQGLASGISYISNIYGSSQIIGISMGGVVARYALAYAEQEGILINVSNFVSVDSPQKGAELDDNFQNWLYNLDDSPADISSEIESLRSIAAKQMLTYNAWNLNGSYHTSFYNNLNGLNSTGWSQNTKNIGVSFSPGYGQNPNSGLKWLSMDNQGIPGISDEDLYISSSENISDMGSFLPKSFTDGKSKGFIYNLVNVEIERYSDPTFITFESATSFNPNQPNNSDFDVVINSLVPTFHDSVPPEIIPPLLSEMGFTPPSVNWSVTPITPNYTISGSWINYSGTFQVQFQDLSTQQNGTITNWLWDFGDNSTSTQQNPIKTFTTYGQHDVKLTVTNSAGVQSTKYWGTLSSTGQDISRINIYPGFPSITGDLFVDSAPGFCQLESKSWKATQNINDLNNYGTIKWKIEKGSKSYFVEGNINSLGKSYLPTNPSFGSFSWNSHIGGDCQAFKLSAQKKVNWAVSVWKEFANGTPIVKLNCDCNLNPGPNDPVCPHIVLNINGQEIVENNILYFSNEQREFGPITDKCLIQNDLPIENGKYVLNIKEIGTSISNLDYFSLETIDVPTGIEVGALAQENQELVFYYPDSLNSVFSADVNGTQDIRSEITNDDSQFFLSDSGDVLSFVVNPVANETCKIIIKTLELDPTIEAQPKYVYGFSVIGGGIEENIASIAYRNKDYTHVLDVSEFVGSENQTTFKLSFRNKVSIDQIAIDTTPIDLNEIQVNQVELSNAELILGGESGVINQLSELSSPDFDYSWLKPNQSLKLEFSFPTQESGTQRKFVLASQGFYVTPSDSISLEVSIPEGFNLFSMPVDSVKQNSNYQELFTNNTNTYFPYTTINYEEVDWTLTDSVFFQQGFSTVAEGSPKTLNFTGKEKLEYDLNLNEGWNLIPSISNEVSIAKYFSSNGGPFREGFYYDYGYKAIDADNAILKPGDAIWVYVDSPIEILNFPYGNSSEPLTKSSSDSLIYLSYNQLLDLNGLIEFSVISAESDTVKLFLAQSDSFSVDNSYFGKPPLPESNLVDSLKFFDAQIYFNDSTYTYANVQDSSNVNLTIRLTAANFKYPISISWTDALGNLQVTTVDSSSLTKLVNLNRSSGKVAMKVNSEQNLINIAGTLKNYKSSIPSKYSLSQNYPNPFNPSTRINYSIPENSFVKLEVFNILGRKVKTLVSNVQKSGNYSVKWNGLNDENKLVSSGVYFYRIESGDFVSIKKMLLLK
ncbi:MAG: T9SS C-terminal target domain-containing protein [Calditrichaeota bacterium]|nr:MAG: T9SS C-terminal target domain-containing protein [Calditrichota bacterium]